MKPVTVLFGLLLASASFPANANATPTTAGLVLHVDRSVAHAGDVVNVTLENTSNTLLVIHYPGGSNGCAVPRFEAFLVDAHRTPIDVTFADVMCTMAIVGPGTVELPAHAKQPIMQIDTRAIPRGLISSSGTRALPPGTYQVHVRLTTGMLTSGYTAASFTVI